VEPVAEKSQRQGTGPVCRFSPSQNCRHGQFPCVVLLSLRMFTNILLAPEPARASTDLVERTFPPDRVRAERLTFEIQSSPDSAEPRQWKPNRIRREGYSRAGPETRPLFCGRPGIRDQRSGPTRRTRPRTPFGHQAGIRKFRAVSLSSAPWECRTLRPPQNMVSTWPTISEHHRPCIPSTFSLFYT